MPEDGPERRMAFRARHAIPADVIVFGFVGRYLHDKGISDLETAWKKLRARVPGSFLVIAGGKDQETVDLKLLLSDDRVRDLGFVSDTRSLYQAIDILVLPSHREGFPVVLLEASAMQLPIIATEATGCVDAVVDGETGTLVPVSSPELLASAMERLANDESLRNRMGRNGRERVLTVFQPAMIHRDLVELYRELGVA